MQATQSKDEMFDNMRSMLREVFHLRSAGVAYARLARAQGYLDGYMRLMLEAGHATKEELLVLVNVERTRADGPLTRTIETSEVAA